MEPIILDQQVSIFSQFLAELRSETQQADRLRFRHNLQRASFVLAYEISKYLSYREEEVYTPLGSAPGHLLDEQPVLVPILRAGMAMHEGFSQVFDQADSGFVSAYRKHHGNSFNVHIEYVSAPALEDRVLILMDPMIATGRSLVLSYEAIAANENPKSVYVASVIASEQGIEHVLRHIPQANLFVGAVDSELTAKSYIVPGLGDAGDLAFGAKE
jgi:uracil phosphoribosyltransferase